jgi:hypothetical protein
MGVLNRFPAAAGFALVVGLADAALGGGQPDEYVDQGGAVFFGFVKDTRGVAIADARVGVVFKNMVFTTRTDALGAYRIGTTTDPDLSEVSCSKDGYRQAGTSRRSQPGAKSPIEIDCTLQRVPRS